MILVKISVISKQSSIDSQLLLLEMDIPTITVEQTEFWLLILKINSRQVDFNIGSQSENN